MRAPDRPLPRNGLGKMRKPVLRRRSAAMIG
jgi:hypothetical protein